MTDIVAEYARLRQEFYEKGFGRRVGFGERPALLVVDLIRGPTDVRSPLARELDGQVQATISLLGAARAAEILVIFSTSPMTPSSRRPASGSARSRRTAGS